MAKNIVKSHSKTYLVIGCILLALYFVLLVLLHLFKWSTSSTGLETLSTTDQYSSTVYIYTIFYFLIPLSYFVGIPVGVVLIIIGTIKRYKKS
jgi:hypothetical protein